MFLILIINLVDLLSLVHFKKCNLLHAETIRGKLTPTILGLFIFVVCEAFYWTYFLGKLIVLTI